MPPPQQELRINVGELKSQIAKRLGTERSQLYFDSLHKLLSNKLCKSEFNKSCLTALGRENVFLHNQLIRSILQNAFIPRVQPPPSPPADETGPAKIVMVKREDGVAPSLNGDISSASIQKCGSGILHRRVKDRSPLAVSTRAELASNQSVIPFEETDANHDKESSYCDLKRPLHDTVAQQPAKRHKTEHASSYEKDSSLVVKDADGTTPRNELASLGGPFHAPFGMPLFPSTVPRLQRPNPLALSLSSSNSLTGNYDSGELCHTKDLRQRMERTAELQGLGGVAYECANLLNNGLDAYLKRLIKSCVNIIGTRLGRQPKKQLVVKQQLQAKPINGVWQENHVHLQGSDAPAEGMHDTRCSAITLQDFKLAMELDPKQLGEDWPSLFEKISFCSFEE